MERIHMEKALLGCIITWADIYPEVKAGIAELEPEDFENDILRGIFKTVRKLFADNLPIDIATVNLTSDETEAVKACVINAAASANFGIYASMLRECSRAAQIRCAGLQLAEIKQAEEAEEIIGRLNLMTAERTTWQPTGIENAIGSFCDRHAEQRKPEFLQFGFEQVDGKLYLENGDFIVIAGEPSSGKTMLAAQMAVKLSEKHRVGFFSLETSEEKLMDRIMSQLSKVPLKRIKENDLSEEDWKAIGDAGCRMSGRKLDLIRAAGMTAMDIQAVSIARGYDVVFVDYLQIVRDAAQKVSRYEAVTNVSMALHTMAQRNRITVIALAQLARPEKRKNGKEPPPPSMHDLRESGQIEQDADAILILYNKVATDFRGNRMLKIAKNKEGEMAAIEMRFQGEIQTFTEEPKDRWVPAATATHYANGAPIPKNRRGRDINELRQFKIVNFEDLPEEEEVPF